MSTRKVLIFAGAAAVAVPLLIALCDQSTSPFSPKMPTLASPDVKVIVEEKLFEHKGESTSFMHAFEVALTAEMNREHGLFGPTWAQA